MNQSSNSRSSFFLQSSPNPPTRSTYYQQFATRVDLHPPFTRGESTALSRFRDHAASSSRPAFDVPADDIEPAEGDIDVQEREVNDSLEDIVMATDLRDRETVGCSYYVAREEKLYCMEDVKYGGLEIMNMCKCFSSIHPFLYVPVDQSCSSKVACSSDYHTSFFESR